MSKIQSSLAFFLALTIIMAVFIFTAPVGAEASYKIEGYIKTASGVPIAGAHVIFNSQNVPSTQTNQQGYYAVNAPAGTYRLNVWPPYNSNFVNYAYAVFV